MNPDDSTSSVEKAVLDVQTWTTLVQATADCLSCGEMAHQAISRRERDGLRRWARAHAAANPGHHVAVETTTARSYRVATPPAPRLANACKCGDCYHPAFGPNTDGEPCDYCQDCGCASGWHISTPPGMRGPDGGQG